MTAKNDEYIMEYLVVNYKSIVYCQTANGSWKEALCNYLKGQELGTIRNEQINEDVKKQDNETLLTLIGLNLLTQHFSENKREWRLVAHKGRTFLKTKLNKDDKQIDELINAVKVELMVSI